MASEKEPKKKKTIKRKPATEQAKKKTIKRKPATEQPKKKTIKRKTTKGKGKKGKPLEELEKLTNDEMIKQLENKKFIRLTMHDKRLMGRMLDKNYPISLIEFLKNLPKRKLEEVYKRNYKFISRKNPLFKVMYNINPDLAEELMKRIRRKRKYYSACKRVKKEPPYLKKHAPRKKEEAKEEKENK